ncbi:MAG: HlyD family efflux transporter periplasmic adaptor subunit [Paludibacter sp.]|jgi:HlyD family secretion protein|nr:HlyD family efflux transporter periplasmic adaptor subunit [Paludibacter sp.]
MQLFPPEIINYTAESHFARRNSKVWVVYLAVLLAAAGAVAALPFVYVPVSTQARGVVRTKFENNQIQTAIYGEIIDIRISENLNVRQGDTLLVLNSENIDVQIIRTLEKISEDSAFISDISALLANKFSVPKTPKYLYERNLYRSSENEQQTRIDYLKNEYLVSEQLYRKDAISKSEYLRDKNNYDNAVRSSDNLREQFRNRWQAERTNYELEIRGLQTDILRLSDEKTKYALLAPVSGAVIQFSGVQRGNFIAPGQSVAQISTSSDLLVECYVSPADIGYIAENQQVKFQLDAFNYNQWGMAQGAVSEISQDIVSSDNQAVFRVRCSLDNRYLQLKNGYRGNIKKGMTLTGRFYLTDRTLWQLLFDKVDNWLNPKTISN